MPKTLLLADDSITIRKVVGIIFASEDYSVTTVDNGEDALAKLREERPDLVLADVVMPRKNGYELCEAVKNDADLRDVPVLLLAGTFEAFDEARAKAVRADGWIQKPFDSATLLGKVREIVEGVAPPPAPSLPYVTAAQPAAAAVPIAPPPPGAPLPAGARPLPGAAPGPFAVPSSQPFAPRPPAPPPPPPVPLPPAPPFAARPPVVPAPPAPPPAPFAVRPPVPPAPPPPPPPTFRAPPPPAPFEARPTFGAPPSVARATFDGPPPTFAAPPPPPPPPVNVVVPLPPPPPAPEARVAPVATLEELDFSGAAFDEPLDAAPEPPAPPPPLPPAPAFFAAPIAAPVSPPPAPAIPTLKVAPPLEPDAELDFDIDEAAAPIDLADLAAEEITEEEALATGEAHAEVAPLPTLDLSREDEPPALDLSSPWDEPLPPRASPFGPTVTAAPEAPPVPLPEDSFADLFADDSRTPPALELQPEAQNQLGELPESEPEQTTEELRLDADPLPVEPVAALTFEDEREPAFTMPAFQAEPPPAPSVLEDEPVELAPPPIAVDADEAVLREVLSRASRETIERVVWEVVPQLAEQIIREQLEQLMKNRNNS